MTSETRLFIKVDDVLAFHFECGTCHATTSVPLAQMKRIPERCINCLADMAGFKEEQTVQAIMELTRQLQNIARLMEQKNFVFRLEVATSDEAA
jgi:hypothetical protein